MIRIELGVTDMGRVRFAAAPAPILDGAMALCELRAASGAKVVRGGRDWRARVRATFPEAARPLGELFTPARAAYLFDMLTDETDHGFDIVAATPTAQICRDIQWLETGGRSRRSAWLRELSRGTHDARQVLDQAVRAYHHRCVAPLWPYVVTTFHDDLARRAATMRSQGVLAMLNDLSPEMSVTGNTIYIRSSVDADVPSTGNGLILIPSAFWTGHPLLTHDRENPADRILIYGANPRRTPQVARSFPSGDPLAPLLGATRARVLRALVRPLTTCGIADCLRISNASASQHAGALRDAGLVRSLRDGQTVVHSLSPIGSELLAGRAETGGGSGRTSHSPDPPT